MTGVLINGAAALAGGVIGLLFQKGISKSIEKSMNTAMGIVVIIIGLNGVISNMFKTGDGGTLHSSGELLLVVSFALGTLLGEVLKLDDKLNGFSSKIEKQFNIEGFSKGFITSSSIFCIGAMGIIGALTSGTTGDNSILITKSIIDFVTAIVLGASLGFGVAFSGVPIVLYEGAICLLAGVLSNVLQGELLLQICMVGYALIICVGLNLMTELKIRVVNMLPSLLVPVGYYFLMKVVDVLGK
jgi:Uncharacterized membrane protein, possible Na+ channel or pump